MTRSLMTTGPEMIVSPATIPGAPGYPGGGGTSNPSGPFTVFGQIVGSMTDVNNIANRNNYVPTDLSNTTNFPNSNAAFASLPLSTAPIASRRLRKMSAVVSSARVLTVRTAGASRPSSISSCGTIDDRWLAGFGQDGERPYEGMNISGVTGITEAQKASLKALGAIELADEGR